MDKFSIDEFLRLCLPSHTSLSLLLVMVEVIVELGNSKLDTILDHIAHILQAQELSPIVLCPIVPLHLLHYLVKLFDFWHIDIEASPQFQEILEFLSLP